MGNIVCVGLRILIGCPPGYPNPIRLGGVPLSEKNVTFRIIWDTRAQSSGQTEQIDTQVYRKHLNQDMINEALITLIIVRNLPFRLIKWPEFHILCQILNPELSDFITATYSQITKKIK
jgi:hypothetical protein